MLFNSQKRAQNQQRGFIKFTHHDFLLKHSARMLTDQLAEFNCQFKNILEIDARYGHLTNQLNLLYPNAQFTIHQITKLAINLPANYTTIIEKDIDCINCTQQFDLIASIFSLHWANDPITTLKKFKNLLSTEGIFTCNFIGGKSLANFRKLLTTYESKITGAAARHISPMIRFQDCQPLIKAAGFDNYVIDSEIVKVSYNSYHNLAKDLRYMGEGTAFNDLDNYNLNHKILRALSNHGAFEEEFEIISITASKDRNAFKNHFSLI